MMKKGLMVVMCLFAVLVSSAAEPLAAEWRAVDEALGKKHSRSAIGMLEKVESKALELKRWPDYTAARLRRLALDYDLADETAADLHDPKGVVAKFAGEIAAAPVVVCPMLRLALMHYYAELAAEERRYEGLRTKIVGEVTTNLPPWSAEQLRPSLAKLFAQVMADAPALQAAKTADWSRLFAVPACIVGKRKNSAPLVLPGNELGIEAVPTLYDFALECCVQLVSHDEIAEHDAQGRLTGFATEVLARLDERIRFHAADTNRTPYAYAKLTRIRFEESVMEDVPGREEKEKEIAAFGAVAEEFFETSWVSALAADDRATILKWKEDKGKDHAELQDYCRRFAAKWPNTPGGDNCRSIVQSLEAPSLDLYVERTWAHPLPSISLEYQNLTGITFRLVRITVDDFAKHDQFSGTLFRIGKTFREYVRRPAAKTWTVNLKPADKLHKFQQTLPVPSDIPKGHYLLFATGNCPGEKTPPIYARMITVTDLAFVTTRIPGGFSGYVLDAEKGTPIADAEVEFWRPVKNEWVRKTTVKTGADGSFFIPEPKERGYLRAVKGTDEVVSPLNDRSAFSKGESAKPKRLEHVDLTPDRAIYRPGQTVKFKGIAFLSDPEKNRFHALANRRVCVSFSDPDGNNVGEITRVSNAFGSFSGEFVIPRDRLTGSYHLDATFCDEDEEALVGELEIDVEAYQRPKFAATIRPVKDAKFGVETRVTGFAKTFTGLPVPNAKVEWRVQRSIYSGDSYSAESVTIARGTVQTDENGEFSFVFTPTATRPKKSKDDLVFVFDLSAEVTDRTGETHETETCDFRIADIPWKASIEFQSEEGWITQTTPTKLAVWLQTRNDEPVVHARGTVEIFALKGPDRVVRAPAPTPSSWCSWEGSEEKLWDVTQWPTDRRVAVFEVITDAKGKLVVETGTLPVGVYQALYKSIAPNGKEVWDTLTWCVIDPKANTYAIREPNYVRLERPMVKIGETARLFWGSGYDDVWCRTIVRRGQKILLDEVRTNTAFCVEVPVTADLAGSLSFETICVRENRLLQETRHVYVPRPNRNLTIERSHLTSKLMPGTEETWTLTVRGAETNDVRPGVELLAFLYDRSLDALDEFGPYTLCSPFAHDENPLTLTPNWGFANSMGIFHLWESVRSNVPRRYWEGFELWNTAPSAFFMRFRKSHMDYCMVASGDFGDGSDQKMVITLPGESSIQSEGAAYRPSPQKVIGGEPPPVTMRKNLNETAFFLPHLITDEKGSVTFSFKVPEALTGWKFMVLAHDAQLRAGVLMDTTIVTTKPLMVEPIAPRFVREGDRLAFPVKVTNRENVPQAGTATLDFFDAATGKPCLLGDGATSQAFTLGPNESKTLMFDLVIPDGCRDLRYVAAAKGENFSDGEEGKLPVLSKRLLVRASLPIQIAQAGMKTATFKELAASAASPTLKHVELAVDIVGDSAWHAFLALPSLKESSHESLERVFSRFYANEVAQHLVRSRPDFKTAVKRVFGDQFESRRFALEQLKQLEQNIKEDGEEGYLWPWFPGGPKDTWVSMYILTGFARLDRLVGDSTRVPKPDDMELVQNGVNGAMARHVEVRKAVCRQRKTEFVPDSLELHWLYLLSFTGTKADPAPFLLARLRETWTRLDLAGTAMAAIVLARQPAKDDQALARTMVQSLKERAVRSEEFGLFWKRAHDFGGSPFATSVSDQTLAMEAFLEVTPEDVASYKAARQWLLEQKRTQNWPTSVSTVDAIYAILRGVDPTASSTKNDDVVTVSLGGVEVPRKAVKADTGFYEYRVPREKITAKLGEVAVSRKTDALGWVSVNWMYLEDAAKVRAFEQAGLGVTKTYYKKARMDGKECLVALNGGEVLEPGDELVARLVLDSNRLYEYVHLRDERPATAEPVDVQSHYRWQGGLGFYQTTGDTAMDYYIDQLPQGRFVLETSYRVRERGTFTSGLASVQCLYAPEFGAHSAATTLTVK